MAKFITKHLVAVKPLSTSPCKKHTPSSQTFHDAGFALSNPQDTKLPAKSFDLVTIMWAFHEAPQWGRDKIIKEARRLLSPGGTLAVIDIATDYVPSKSMLMGEPFVKEYQQHIHQQLAQFKGFRRLKYVDVVPRHLGMWTLTRSATIA
jgi:ubiquinone/menaquinone biosynthesis C-methylase UbiE